MSDEDEIYFSADGYSPPEGTEDDKDFTEVCTMKRKADGRYCLKMVAGMPCKKAQSTESEEEEYEEEKTSGQRMMEQFQSKGRSMGDMA